MINFDSDFVEMWDAIAGGWVMPFRRASRDRDTESRSGCETDCVKADNSAICNVVDSDDSIGNGQVD